MIRILLTLCACAALVACSDRRGSQYSSARASQPAPTYYPVTPGATPVSAAPQAAIPVSVAPAGTPVPTANAPAAVITQAAVLRPQSAPVAPAPAMRFAKGPIYTACQSSGRKAASRARCGCVQWVANQELSAEQQRRGAGYFNNQHALQEVRQSSERVRSNGAFWEAWKTYGAQASRQCRGS